MAISSPVRSRDEVRLAEVLAALSLATDLANSFQLEKGLRNCMLAVLLGRDLGLRGADLSDVYYFGLLRSIGCTSYAYEETLATGDDQAFRRTFAGLDSGRPGDVLGRAARLGAGGGVPARARAVAGFLTRAPRLIRGMAAANCEAGVRLANRLGLGPGVAAALSEIHERWDGKGIPGGLKAEGLSIAARIGVFAHDVTVHLEDSDRRAVCEMVRKRAGTEHDPEVSQAFLRRADDLLDAVGSQSVWDAVVGAEPEPRPWLPASRLDALCAALADFADLKSPFTLGHSTGTAALASRAARLAGASETDQAAIFRAGLLHDLGRVSVSNAIWDKAGQLSPAEWERVRLHPYYSERVLERSPALRPLSRLAGSHHERLDGSGYHRGDPAALLPLPSRLLAAADAYQAMSEERSHRPALAAEQAVRDLVGEVEAGRLDREAVAAVLEAAGQASSLPRKRWPADLTDREVEVLRLVVRGRPNRQVAKELFISEETVRTHVRHLYEKVGLSSRAGLALFAMENDLLRA